MKKITINLVTIIGCILPLIIASCIGWGGNQLSVPEGAKAGDLVDVNVCEYKANKVKYPAECSTLIVEENRNDSTSRLIALPLIRVLAQGNTPSEPIFWLAGGPGGTNMKFPDPKDLIESHDIVMVGYRGMDGSIVLECPELAKAAKGVGDNFLSNASISNFSDATNQCAERVQTEGVDLDGYSIQEVAEDMETARIALGYEKVNLLSASYGTRVAMIYAWMHPDSLSRSAMISVNPPGHFAWEPEVLDAQFSYDAELCARDPYCSERTENLVESIKKVLNNLPKRWLMISIDPGKVKFITHFMLFHRGTSATVFDAYLAAENGDFSGIALMSLAHDFMIPSVVTWGDWISKGSVDYDPARDWSNDMNPDNSIMGSPTSMLVGAAAQMGGGWPVAPIPDAFYKVQPSDVETLLVSGSIDYSTPSQFASEELLPSLSNGKQVILSEFGHFNDMWGLQPQATKHLLSTFFDSGEVDDSLFNYQAMDFRVKLGFPMLAKVGLAILIVLIAGLFLVVRSVIRRRKRRKQSM